MTGTDFWKYTGEPTDEEIQAVKAWDKAHPDHLAIRLTCPTCGSTNTMWRRQRWSVCFNCDSSFTIQHELESQEDADFWSQFE